MHWLPITYAVEMNIDVLQGGTLMYPLDLSNNYHVYVAEGFKTVAVFCGCATHLGCTISLTGGSIFELQKVHIMV